MTVDPDCTWVSFPDRHWMLCSLHIYVRQWKYQQAGNEYTECKPAYKLIKQYGEVWQWHQTSPSSFRKYANCLVVLILMLWLYPAGMEEGIYPSPTPKPLLQNPPCLYYPLTAANKHIWALYVPGHLYNLLQAIGVPNTTSVTSCVQWWTQFHLQPAVSVGVP